MCCKYKIKTINLQKMSFMSRRKRHTSAVLCLALMTSAPFAKAKKEMRHCSHNLPTSPT